MTLKIFVIALVFLIGMTNALPAAEPLPVAEPEPLPAANPEPLPAANPEPLPEANPEPQEKASPMYSAHDFASGQLQQRRTIANGNPCDSDFGSQLEGIVTEMEQNKEAAEELANKLRTQFTEMMEKNADKNLCVNNSWCDLGVCKPRQPIKIKGRSMSGGGGGNAASNDEVETPTKKSESTGSGSSSVSMNIFAIMMPIAFACATLKY